MYVLTQEQMDALVGKAEERVTRLEKVIVNAEAAGDDKAVLKLNYDLIAAKDSVRDVKEVLVPETFEVVNKFFSSFIKEELYSAVIAKLSYRLGNGYPSLEGKDEHRKAHRKLELAATLLIVLEEVKMVKIKVNKNQDSEGNWHTEKTVMPTVTASPLKILTKGANIQPTLVKKRVVVKVGGKSIKLPSKLRKQAKLIGEQGLKLIDTDRDIFKKYLELSNLFTKTEFASQAVRGMLLDDMLNSIDHLRGRSNFLDVWYDSRLRMYYSLNTLEGIRPQGKLFEVCQWELPIGEVITDSGARHIKHAIVNLLDGRLSLDKANKLFNLSHLVRLKRLADSIMKAKDQDEMGEAMYASRLYTAYSDYRKGLPSKVIFGKDFTSSGPGIAGVSFRSEALADAANWNGGDTANDLHMSVADALGVTERNAAKKVNAPIFHGSTYKAAAEAINEYLGKDSFKPKDIENLLAAKFGKAIDNIPAIAEWGGESAINSQNPSLSWKSMDGLPCQSVAYYEGYEIQFRIYNPFNGKTSQTKIVRDMPVLFNNNGDVFQDKTAYKTLKKRGLFANITHSIDSWMLREIQKATNFRGVWKHDDFVVHPNDFDKVIDTARNCMLKVYDTNPYQEALVQIERVVDSKCMPTLFSGDLKRENVERSVNFLMPE